MAHQDDPRKPTLGEQAAKVIAERDALRATDAVYEAEAAMLAEQDAAREVAVGKLLTEADSERLNELSNTTDAKEWAREFRRVAATHGIAVDWGWMVGWFANAIETGRAAGAAKERERLNAMIDAGTADGRDLVERLVAAKEERDGAEKDAADMAGRLGDMDSRLNAAETALEGERRLIRDLRELDQHRRNTIEQLRARLARTEDESTPMLGVYSGHLTVNAAWRHDQAVEVTLSGPMDTVEAVMTAAIDSLRNEAEK